MKYEITGVENLHRHSDFSLLDGFARVEEYAERMKEINQKFLCITDHGVMGAIPQQIAESDKHGLHPLFGIELYVNPMQPKTANRTESAEYRKSLGNGSKEATPEQKKFDKSSHLLAIAYNLQGYSNLVRLSSWAWIHGFYRKPRVNHEVLLQYKEGIVFTSACGNSEIANAFMGDKSVGFNEEAGMAMVEKYLAMFGDKFYLELMMLDWKMQKPYDAFLLRAHAKYNIPIIMSSDCFVAGTIVTTDKGVKKIEDIVVGDKVLTHLGHWREVEITGSRPLRKNEKIYKVAAEAGTFAYEATGNHEVYATVKNGEDWQFEWIRTDQLIPKEHYLLMPKISEKDIFAENDVEYIDLMPFLKDCLDKIKEKKNMDCGLQFNEESQEFWSYRGWDKRNKTTISRMLKVDDDLLQIIGWFIAEGWSEKESNQVGFAFHEEEKHVADWIIKYFEKYDILVKIHKDYDEKICVVFSSVVFNRFFGELCGYGDNNKHLPRIVGCGLNGYWSKRQMSMILRCYWRGDCNNTSLNNGISFGSTSKILINEIALIFNSCGIVSIPRVQKSKESACNDSYHVDYTADRGYQAVSFLMKDGKCNKSLPQSVLEIDSYYVFPIKSVEESEEKDCDVYCFRVNEDHSFTAGFYAVSNCHYCKKEHSHNQRLMLMQKNKYTLADIDTMIRSGEADELFELQDTNLWLKSEDEFNEKWELDYQDTIDYDLFKQAKSNTVKLAEFAKGVKLDREIKLPKIPDAELVLWEEVKKGFVKRRCPKEPKYIKRVREEYDLIIEKGFASYFLIQKMMIDEARDYTQKHLGFSGVYGAGPGRGCLHPMTPIRLQNGSVKAISEIMVGDKVYTIDGTAQEVENNMVYDLRDEKLLRIKTYYGDNFGVPLTSDHKVYVERHMTQKEAVDWCNQNKNIKTQLENKKPIGKCEWIAAANVRVGDWCFVPIPIVKTFSTNEPLNPNSINKLYCVPDCVINGHDSIVEKYLFGFFMSKGIEEDNEIKFYIDSHEQAEQIRFLLLRLGIPSSLITEGGSDCCGQKYYIVKCPLDTRIGASRTIMNDYGWHRVEKGIMLRVREVVEENGPEHVYDIQVAGNHNYLTSSFLVHNSVCGSLLAYVLGLHDLDPIHHDLRFSRFLSPARGGKQTKFRHTIKPIPHEKINLGDK